MIKIIKIIIELYFKFLKIFGNKILIRVEFQIS